MCVERGSLLPSQRQAITFVIFIQRPLLYKSPLRIRRKTTALHRNETLHLKPRLNHIPQSFVRQREALTLDDRALSLKRIAYLAVNWPRALLED